jgi:hypothetical protein
LARKNKNQKLAREKFFLLTRCLLMGAHPQFLDTALPRWRRRAKARGRAFTHAELGGNLLVKERWLRFRNGMARSLR